MFLSKTPALIRGFVSAAAFSAATLITGLNWCVESYGATWEGGDPESSAGPIEVTVTPLPWIPPGTHVGKEPPKGWSHLISVARSRVAAGDVDKIPGLAADSATMFTISLLANRVPVPREQGTTFKLDKVAIGIGYVINGRNIIISSETQERLGANLGFVGRRVLSGYEAAMKKDTVQLVRSSTMLVFDARVIVYHRGDHRDMVLRHAVLVSRTTGQLGALFWLLDHGPNSTYVLADRHMHFLPPDFQEDRVLRYDADKTFLGIPAEDSIAINQLPRGTPVPFTPQLKALAAAKPYSVQSARRLEAELWKLWTQ